MVPTDELEPEGLDQHDASREGRTHEAGEEDDCYDVEQVLAEMERTLRPTREQFEMVRDADWGDVLHESPDPVALIDRLAKLGARLDRQGYSGGEVCDVTGEVLISGAKALWRCWAACCLSLPDIRPELAYAECAISLAAIGRVVHTFQHFCR